MIFLTEEDIRHRCDSSGTLCLNPQERLTPAAAELVRSRNCKVVVSAGTEEPVQEACQACASGPEAAAPCCACAESGTTYLDAATIVSKSHPRIFLRGKLDTLIAAVVLVQTQFDVRAKLPEIIKNGLADVNVWLWQILQAEVSGNDMPAVTLCGMTGEAIRLVSHDPMKYLNQGHLVPDVALGPNVALLNWLRAQVREVEVAAVQVGLERTDVLEAINRLSSAVYVLMLLTVVAESGRDLSKLGTF